MKNIACSRVDGLTAAQGAERRRPGGQPGNRNAWRHGRHGHASLARRKAAHAEAKLLAIAAHALGMVPGRCRVRPLRVDQIAVLAQHRPGLLALARNAGVNQPGL